MTAPIRLRSGIPGRERWDVPALRGKPALAAAVQEGLLRTPGVIDARTNPVTARVLIAYSPGSDLHCAGLIRAQLDKPAPAEDPEAPGGVGASALRRLIGRFAPSAGQASVPILLSTVGQFTSLAQSFSFVAIMNTARGEGPGFLKLFGRQGRGAGLGLMTGVAVSVTTANLFVQSAKRRAWHRLALETEHRLRSALFEKVQAQDLAFFDGAGGRVGLMQILTDDVDAIREYVQEAGSGVIEKSIITLVSGTALFSASMPLGLMVLLTSPFFLLPARLLRERISIAHRLQSDAATHLQLRLDNSLAGVVDVKTFNAEQYEQNRVEASGRNLLEATHQASAASSLQALITEGIFTSGFHAAAAYAGSLFALGKISQTRYNWLVFLIPRLVQVPAQVADLTRMHHRAVQAAERIMPLLESRPTVTSGPKRLRRVRGEVVFESVSFGYRPSVPVLKEVSFELRSGETLAIVGPTGSGKSTLLRLLLRFYDVDQGRILLDGHDVRDLDLRDIRSGISMLSQDSYLFQGTLRDNVRYCRPDASEEEVLEALRQARASELPDLLPGGLDAEVGERGRLLSGGQRQRVAIARVLLKDARVLALDEATSHLDYETEAAVQSSVHETTTDRTTILVAHRLSTIRQADRILVLEGGTITESGRHAELVEAGGLYASLWRLQSGESEPGLEVRMIQRGNSGHVAP